MADEEAAASAAELSSEQLEPFDMEFRDWAQYRAILSPLLRKPGRLIVLDVGGGNGQFLDHLLADFPNCEGILLDNSEYMLRKNSLHARKRLVRASALEIDDAIAPGSCDLVTVNVLLHHLVRSTYQATTATVVSALRSATRLLRPGGHIVVYEQVYDGLVPSVEPGALIYALTRLHIPFFTPLLRRFGANTAGVGVCFRSSRSWETVFRTVGLRVTEQLAVHQDAPPMLRKLAFLIRRVGTQIFVLAPSHIAV